MGVKSNSSDILFILSKLNSSVKHATVKYILRAKKVAAKNAKMK